MATLQQLIDNLDRSQESEYVDIESLAQSEFRIYVDTYIEGENPLKSYWLGKWYCTDSYVGFKAYFFNDEFVCWSKQVGRKCDENFYWKDKESFEKVRAWCISLLIEEELQPDLMEGGEIVGYKCHTTNSTKFFGNRATPTNNSIENLTWIDKK